MANETAKYVIGTLILIVLASGIFLVSLEDKARIKLDKDKATFYVQENNRWVVSGREYLKLYDGSTLISRDTKNIILENKTIGDTLYLRRITPFRNGASIIDTYIFDGKIDDVELFPVSHIIEVKDGEGLILQYEARDLKYDGPTVKDVSSPQSFGRNMNLRWSGSSYWNTLYKSGSLKLRYKVKSSSETYEIRLFDPLRENVSDQDSVPTLYSNVNLSNARGRILLDDFVSRKTNGDIASAFVIDKNSISLDHTLCEECDVPATVTFQDTGFNNPQVFHNGHWEEGMVPLQIGDDDYQITVTSWSEWSLDQGTFEGTFNGTTLYGGANIVSKAADGGLILEFDDNITGNTLTDLSLYNFLPSIEAYHTGPNDDRHSTHIPAKIGNGVQFNGIETRVIFPLSPFGQKSLNFTTMLWINTSTVTNIKEVAPLGEGRSGIFLSSTGVPTCRSFTSTENQVGGTLDADNRTYVFVACVYINGSVQNTTSFVNGIKTKSSDIYPSFISGTDSYLAENPGTVAGNPYSGIIDEFKFFNRSLSDAEILSIYNSEVTGVHDPAMDTTSLIVELRFNETDGFIALDNRNSFHGTLERFYRASWNATGGVFGGSAYHFNGNGSSFNFSGIIELSRTLQGNGSFALWINPTNISLFETDALVYGSFAGSIEVRLNSSDIYLINNISAANTRIGKVPYNYTDNKYTLFGSVIYANGTKRFFVNQTLVASDSATLTTYLDIGTDEILIGARPGSPARTTYHGFVDDVKFWNRSLNDSEFNLLYSAKNTFRFKPGGDYTTVTHNINSTIVGASGSTWVNFSLITLDSAKDNFTVKGRAGDDCSTVNTLPFVTGTRLATNNSIFNFTSLIGQCAQFEIGFDSNRNDSNLVYNYTTQGVNIDCQTVTTNLTLAHNLNLASFNGNKNACLVVNTNNVRIDFNGFKIRGNGTLSTGILNNGFNNVILKSPLLSNFDVEIAATNITMEE